MQVKSIKEADVSAKRVLVRCDFDVPVLGGKVVDDLRLREAVPTLNFLRERGAKSIVLIGHLGRPGGKVVEGLRVTPVVARLAELTNMSGVEVRENLRFDPREENNDQGFAKELANLGDIYVNESFANSHRNHASIIGVPKFLPSYMGLNLEKEVEHLSLALTPPPGSIAIIGGAKFETKAPLIEKLARLYTKVLVGGNIANEYTVLSQHVVLPLDGVEDSAGHVSDIGIKTIEAWNKEISAAPFVLWNGPLGMYEGGYMSGTDTLAHTLATSNVRAVVGGGDTIAAVSKFAFDPKKVFTSTGGGAMLEFLVSGTLAGLEALKS